MYIVVLMKEELGEIYSQLSEEEIEEAEENLKRYARILAKMYLRLAGEAKRQNKSIREVALESES